jgi:hypothetical protein
LPGLRDAAKAVVTDQAQRAGQEDLLSACTAAVLSEADCAFVSSAAEGFAQLKAIISNAELMTQERDA